MRSVIFIAAVAIVLALSTPASGQEYRAPRNADVSDPCPTYDSCTMFRYFEGSYGTGGFIPVSCKKPACRTCSADTRRCVSVYLNATCTCQDYPLEGAGPNITYCGDLEGSCYSTY